MRLINTIAVFTFTLIMSAGTAFSQSKEIKIRHIANAGMYITDGTQNIYFDFPYKPGAYGYTVYSPSELDSIKKENATFIFTHKHADHHSGKLLRKLKGKKYTPWNVSALSKLNTSMPDFSIRAFKTKHRFSLKHYSYLLTWHGKKIFINGDTENPDTICNIKNIDWAFVPVWIVVNAKERNMHIDAKKIGIYHVGPNDDITLDKQDKVILLKGTGQEMVMPY